MEVIGRYEILHRLGSGGMAEVFLGRARGEGGFEKLVAVKRILPHLAQNHEFVSMFIDEARISATLSHSNIGQIFEFGRADEGYFLAMEFVPGLDLRGIHRHLRRSRELAPPAVAAYLIQQVCAGLEHAHGTCDATGRPLGIIHRDVSPSNVLVSFEGEVKLIDFGIAKAARRMTETVGAGLKGKYAYMSPEQALGRELDARSDVFGAGILLFELLTGKNPFLGENDLATLERVRRAKVAAPSSYRAEVDAELDAICLRALRREPAERFTSAGELGEALERHARRTGFTARQAARWIRETFAEALEEHRQLLREVRERSEAAAAAPPARELGPPPAPYLLVEPARPRGDPRTGPFPARQGTPVGPPAGFVATPVTGVGKVAVPTGPAATGTGRSLPGGLLPVSSAEVPVRRRTPVWVHLLGFALFALVVAGVLYLALGRGGEREASRGAIAVQLEPPQSAQIFIDDELHGAADSSGRYSAPGLLAGKHRVRVQSARIPAVEQIVEVVAGRTTRATLRVAPR
jgi:serine/threonine protein kinase